MRFSTWKEAERIITSKFQMSITKTAKDLLSNAFWVEVCFANDCLKSVFYQFSEDFETKMAQNSAPDKKLGL